MSPAARGGAIELRTPDLDHVETFRLSAPVNGMAWAGIDVIVVVAIEFPPAGLLPPPNQPESR
ncbi:hypothetical protein [Candidatus Protofrankia californiensis]|uniref:hypothetical protein n=1 Tax=Candidatus Protofrankia californiensis TaxID=1839754 RepID=UPI00104133F0|nr:hypothetical protein [Candidatus Protofrankia californiensis]